MPQPGVLSSFNDAAPEVPVAVVRDSVGKAGA